MSLLKKLLIMTVMGNISRDIHMVWSSGELPNTVVFKELQSEVSIVANPDGIYLLKVNNRNTRTRCEICSKLTMKTPEKRQWHRSGVFIVNFEDISHLFLVFLLLTLNMYRAYSAIVAHMRLPFFEIFSNFVQFWPNFQIFCPFLPFFC